MDWKSYQNDPLLNEIEKEATCNIRQWLSEKVGIRKKFYNGLQISESRNKSLTAFHEAGHVIMMWYSTIKMEIMYSTIVPVPANGAVGRFLYSNTKEYFSVNPENTKKYQFDAMCLYMGGIREEQRHYPTSKNKILQCQRDIHHLCIKAYRLAKLTMNELGVKDMKKLAHLYIKISFEVATEILRRYKKEVKSLAENLFLYDTVSYEELLTILGPRPIKETSYYEEFVKGKVLVNEVMIAPQTFIASALKKDQILDVVTDSGKTYIRL